ncbi:hypothetical protein ACOMHN_033755 [Nucella lapillus]
MSRQVGASRHTLSWRQFVKLTYPDILTETYCVPPLHFNRVPYDRVAVPGIPTPLPALVSKTPMGGVPNSNLSTKDSVCPATSSSAVTSTVSPTTDSVSTISCNQAVTASPPTTDSVSTCTKAVSTPASPSTGGCANSQTVHTTCQSSTPGGAQPTPAVPPPPSNPPPSLSDYSLWPTDTHPAATPTQVYLSDTSDDFSQQHLLFNLHALAKHSGEVMFILSSVNFRNYLTCPSSPTVVGKKKKKKQQQFPRPTDLKKHIQGDFDFLVIHRHKGILVGEMKSVGRQRTELKLSQGDDDADVVKRLDKGLKQLEKGRDVVSHLVRDVVTGPLPVQTSLFLPYVSRTQLLRVLTANPALAQKVCSCLAVATPQQAVDMTLCSDDLSDPNVSSEVTAHVLHRLTCWWQRRMTAYPGQPLRDDQYMDIVGRFVGPATTVSVHCNARPRLTVEVRTEGEAVAELGLRLARLVLTPEQVDLLQRAPPRAYLTGPPGTGKSVMLILMALGWLHRGWNVQVVSTSQYSIAASRLVHHQIRKTLESSLPEGSATAGHVSLHSLQFHEGYHGAAVSMETAVETLTKAAQFKAAWELPVCVIMDEAELSVNEAELVTKLRQEDPNLHLWAANIKRTTYADIQVERMTRPLRSAPCVVRQIQRAAKSRHYSDKVEPYCTEGIPSPADGLSPSVIYHHGSAHTGDLPASCYQCGVDVANALHALGIGKAGKLVPNSPSSLQFRDVLILESGSKDTVNDDLKDPEGAFYLPASSLVIGLRAEGIPVCVIADPHHQADLEDGHRWERHHRNGCALPTETSELGDDLNALFDYVEEEIPWHEMSPGSKDSWRLHFEEGCKAESQELKEQWKTYKQEERKGWKTRLEDMVTAQHDEAVMTTDQFVQGLERKVVVTLMRPMIFNNATDRMGCMSRCTTHLVIVHSGDPALDPTDTAADSDEDQAKTGQQ